MFKGMKYRDTLGKKKQADVHLPAVLKAFSPSLPPSCSASAPCVDVSASLPALEEVITGTVGGLGVPVGPPADTRHRAHPAFPWGKEDCLGGGLGLFKGKLLIDTLDYGDLEESRKLKKFFFIMKVV